MENTQEQTQQISLEQVQLKMQSESILIQTKLEMLKLAKEIGVLTEAQRVEVVETYLDLREEILGIPREIKKD